MPSAIKSSLPRGRRKGPLLPEQQDILAFLAALSTVLSAFEYLIPKPVPFFRLGLANLPFLLGLSSLSGPALFLLVILKVLGQGLINGTLFSYVFLFSLAGSAAGGGAMTASHRLGRQHISLIGVSLAGALASNLAQLATARFFLLGQGTRFVALPLLATGMVSALLLGITAQLFQDRSLWLRQMKKRWQQAGPIPAGECAPDAEISPGQRDSESGPGGIWNGVQGEHLFAAGLLMVPSLVFQPSPWLAGGAALFFMSLAVSRGRKMRWSFTLLFWAGITLLYLLNPYGEVLFQRGFLVITQGALEAGFSRGALLAGLIALSRFSLKPPLKLPGALGGLLARVFFYFEGVWQALPEKRPRGKNRSLRPAGVLDHLVSQLDTFLLRLTLLSEKRRAPGSAGQKRRKTTAGGCLLLVILILAAYGWTLAGWLMV